MDGSAQLFQMGGERIRDALCSALRNGPTYGVHCDRQHDADCGAERRFKAQKGMRGQPCEDGSRARVTELIVSEEFGWLHGVHPEAREQKWMTRHDG